MTTSGRCGVRRRAPGRSRRAAGCAGSARLVTYTVVGHGDRRATARRAGRRRACAASSALRLVDDADARSPRSGSACTQAGASPAGQPVAAHVALAHDAALVLYLRHVVRAGERAVLAADALVVEVADDAGDRILLVGLDRAAVQAGRVDAVVAGGGHRLLHGRVARAAVQQADAAPGLVVVEAVQAVAGGDARLAAGAGVEVDLEARTAGPAPAARAGSGLGSSRPGRRVAGLVALGEALDGGQIPLFQQQLADQKALRRCGHDPSKMRDRGGVIKANGFKLLKLLSFLEMTSRRSRNRRTRPPDASARLTHGGLEESLPAVMGGRTRGLVPHDADDEMPSWARSPTTSAT